jgi:hypothetical protein
VPSELIVDCSGQMQPQVNEISDQDLADRLAGLAEANQRRDAAAADRHAAQQQLAEQARAGEPVNAGLLARLIGVDVVDVAGAP